MVGGFVWFVKTQIGNWNALSSASVWRRGADGLHHQNEMQRALCSSIIANGSNVTVGSVVAELMRQGHDVPAQDVRQMLKHRQKKQKKQGLLQNVAAAQSFMQERKNWQSGELYVAFLEASSKHFAWVGLVVPFFKALVPLCKSEATHLPLGFFLRKFLCRTETFLGFAFMTFI